jgi:hypothetical protein
MTDQNEIRAALQEIPAGTEVRLRLKDGGEAVGTLQDASSEDAVTLADADDVPLDQVEGVLLESVSEGPE